MKRVTTAVLAGATVATLAYASASALTVHASPLQVGSNGVTCDDNGVTVDWFEVDDGTHAEVWGVAIGDIDTDCFGANLRVAIDGEVLVQNPVITATGHNLSFLPKDKADITEVKVWID